MDTTEIIKNITLYTVLTNISAVYTKAYQCFPSPLSTHHINFSVNFTTYSTLFCRNWYHTIRFMNIRM